MTDSLTKEHLSICSYRALPVKDCPVCAEQPSSKNGVLQPIRIEPCGCESGKSCTHMTVCRATSLVADQREQDDAVIDCNYESATQEVECATAERDAARTERDRLREALRRIKGMVCGEAAPRWENTPATTLTRGNIADICDIALGSAEPRASDEPSARLCPNADCALEDGHDGPCDAEPEEHYDCPMHGLQDGPDCPRC